MDNERFEVWPTAPPDRWIDLGGVVVPSRLRARYHDDELPYRLELDLAVEDGRLVCETLRIERDAASEPVTTEGLRRIPVADLVTRAGEQALHSPAGDTQIDLDAVDQAIAAIDTADGPTDEVLRVVALIYRVAHLCGHPPTQTVAERLDVPRPTAGRWVGLARKRSLLGPASDRRAGELSHHQIAVDTLEHITVALLERAAEQRRQAADDLAEATAAGDDHAAAAVRQRLHAWEKVLDTVRDAVSGAAPVLQDLEQLAQLEGDDVAVHDAD